MEINKKTIKTVFFGVAGCILLYWLLHETDRVQAAYRIVAGVLSPFVIGAVLAFILNVPMRYFEGKMQRISNLKLRRAIAVVLTLIALLLVIALVVGLLIPQVVETAQKFAAKLPGFFNNLSARINLFLQDNPELMEWVTEYTDLEKLNIASYLEKAVDQLVNGITVVVRDTISVIGGVAKGVVNAVISIAFALYCLFRKETLARQGRKLLYAFLKESTADYIVKVLRLANTTFSNFLSGQCLEVCILGCMFAITMAIFRMPYIPLVSVLVAVTAFIPIVGAFAGCVLGALFILVDNPMQALGFVVMFLVIQQIEGNLIYPRVVGKSVGLPGMWVLLAVAVGGEMMGIAGMFLMIPMASVLYAMLRDYTNNRLQTRNVDEAKLKEQPPELNSALRPNRAKKQKKEKTKKDDSKE